MILTARNALKRCIVFSCGNMSRRCAGAWCLRCAICGCGIWVKITFAPHSLHVCDPDCSLAPHCGQVDMETPVNALGDRY